VLIFSSQIALATGRDSIRTACVKAAVVAPRWNKQTRQTLAVIAWRRENY